MHGSRVDPPQSTVADHDPGRPVPFDWPNPGPSFGARARDLRQPDYSPLPGEGYRVPGYIERCDDPGFPSAAR